MGFLWFGKKRDYALKEEIKNSFESVKQDIDKISLWITHLHTKDGNHDKKISEIYDEILKIKEDIDDIKTFISFFNSRSASKVFKHQQTPVYKQTCVEGVQTRVQTGVQTHFFDSFLSNLTTSERVIVWVILNSEIKLSCDDIAVLTGKDKTTIRGQLNSIKRKNENLIIESIEKNGKKRYFIDPSIKELLLKKLKNRVKNHVVKKRKSESLDQ